MTSTGTSKGFPLRLLRQGPRKERRCWPPAPGGCPVRFAVPRRMRGGVASCDTERRAIVVRMQTPAIWTCCTYLLHSGSNRCGAIDVQLSSETYVPRPATPPSLDELRTAADTVDAGRSLPFELVLAPSLYKAYSIGSNTHCRTGRRRHSCRSGGRRGMRATSRRMSAGRNMFGKRMPPGSSGAERPRPPMTTGT